MQLNWNQLTHFKRVQKMRMNMTCILGFDIDTSYAYCSWKHQKYWLPIEFLNVPGVGMLLRSEAAGCLFMDLSSNTLWTWMNMLSLSTRRFIQAQYWTLSRGLSEHKQMQPNNIPAFGAVIKYSWKQIHGTFIYWSLMTSSNTADPIKPGARNWSMQVSQTKHLVQTTIVFKQQRSYQSSWRQ